MDLFSVSHWISFDQKAHGKEALKAVSLEGIMGRNFVTYYMVYKLVLVRENQILLGMERKSQ